VIYQLYEHVTLIISHPKKNILLPVEEEVNDLSATEVIFIDLRFRYP
jgi:hypothetical protein